jgi:hypothetical protein
MNPEDSKDYRASFENGVQTFSLLFCRWMDTNEWSHPTMTALAKACMNGVGWLHSSQISGLRHAKLESPGPRTFIAIERLNYFVWRYATTKALLPGTESSNAYRHAYPITENGEPPPLGWWVEVFCGARMPSDIDLRQSFFTEAQASDFCRAWGRTIRRLMAANGVDLITDLERTVREHYPARDVDRVDLLLQVIRDTRFWTPDELAMELPALTAFTAEMGGPATEDALLKEMQR